MLKQIIFQTDWWLHLLVTFLLWGFLYLIEAKYLKRPFKSSRVLLQLLLANLIDLDHLFSTPIYDPLRCSINNHFFHKTWLLPVYALGLLTRYRYFFLGVLVHLLVDYLGCIL